MKEREAWDMIERWSVKYGLQKEIAGTTAHSDLANQIASAAHAAIKRA